MSMLIFLFAFIPQAQALKLRSPTDQSNSPSVLSHSVYGEMLPILSEVSDSTAEELHGNYSIPSVVHQCAAGALSSHSWSKRNIDKFLKRNPSFQYNLLTDVAEKGVLNSTGYLHKYFDKRVSAAFEQLGLGAAKGDFMRYCILYKEGGLYFDLDTLVDHDVIKDGIIKTTDKCVLFYDKWMNVVQEFLAFAPKHEFLGQVISEMVRRIEQRVSNIWLTTGPHMFTDVYLSLATGQRIFGSQFHLPAAKSSWRQSVIEKNGASFLHGRMLPFPRYKISGLHDRIDGKKHYHAGNGDTPGMYSTFAAAYPPTKGLYRKKT